MKYCWSTVWVWAISCRYTDACDEAKAGMAELADAADSKSAEGNLVGVQPPLPAPKGKLLRISNLAKDVSASNPLKLPFA